MPRGTDLTITLSTDPPLVSVGGEIDLETADRLREAADELAAVCPEGPLVFDVAHVTFMDSSGLAVLVRLTVEGRSVVLRDAPPIVRTLVAAASLDEVLALEP